MDFNSFCQLIKKEFKNHNELFFTFQMADKVNSCLISAERKTASRFIGGEFLIQHSGNLITVSIENNSRFVLFENFDLIKITARNAKKVAKSICEHAKNC